MSQIISGIYFACAMLLVSMSCLMTVVVLNVHFKGEYGTRFPTWMRFVFFRGIGRVLGASPIDNKVNDVRFFYFIFFALLVFVLC